MTQNQIADIIANTFKSHGFQTHVRQNEVLLFKEGWAYIVKVTDPFTSTSRRNFT